MKSGIKRRREEDEHSDDLNDNTQLKQLKQPSAKLAVAEKTISSLPTDVLEMILDRASMGKMISPALGGVNRAFRRAYNSVLKKRFKIADEIAVEDQQFEVDSLLQNKEKILERNRPSIMVRITTLISSIPNLQLALLICAIGDLRYSLILPGKWLLDMLSKGARAIGIATDELSELYNRFSKQVMEDETAFQVRESTLNQLNSCILRNELLDNYEFHGTNRSFTSSLITRLPSTFLSANPRVLPYWSGVAVLNLSSLQLIGLPKEIGQLTGLVELSLYGNYLTSLPGEIGQLQALDYLNLGYNKLTSLPTEMGQLQNLEFLTVENNLLSVIPAEIGQLPALEELLLSGNQLMDLPDSISEDVLFAEEEDGLILGRTKAQILERQQPLLSDDSKEDELSNEDKSIDAAQSRKRNRG